MQHVPSFIDTETTVQKSHKCLLKLSTSKRFLEIYIPQ